MNFFHKLGNALDVFRQKGTNLSPTLYGPVQSGVFSPIEYSDANIPVSTDNAHTISAVWNANIQIAQDIATFPIRLYRDNGGVKTEVKSHPALDLLNYQPNGSMSAHTLRRSNVSQYNLRGNMLCYIKQKRGGSELVLIDPDRSRAKISTRGNKFFDMCSYLHEGKEYEYKDVPAYKVIHVPNHCISGLWGIDVIENFRNLLGLTMAQEKYNSKYYANNASPSGILKVPQTLKDGDSDRYRDEFQKKAKSGVVVLGTGMEYQQLSITPEQSQFLQSRKFSVEEIARMFNMPMHKIKSLDRATNNNIEYQSKEYYQDTLQPILIQIECEYKKLLTEDEIRNGYYFQHDMDEILRADVKTRWEAYAAASTHKILKRNEIRAKEGFEPLDKKEADFNDFQSPANTPKQ